MQITQKAKAILAEVKALQLEPDEQITYCPRCGRNNVKMSGQNRRLSRYEDVYVCSDCHFDEIAREITRIPALPLSSWVLISYIRYGVDSQRY